MGSRRRVVSVSGASVGPLGIAGCVLWLRADLGITKDGSNKVSAWADQSGNGNHASQATGDKQPLWVDAARNGNAVIRFDGVDDRLTTVAFACAQPLTILALVRQIAWTAGDRIWDGLPQDRALLGQVTATPTLKMYAGTAFVADNTDLAVGTYGVISQVYNGAASAQRINSGTDTTGNPGATGITNGLSIGAHGADSAWANCDIGELVVYSGALSAANRSACEMYLLGRYGLP